MATRYQYQRNEIIAIEVNKRLYDIQLVIIKYVIAKQRLHTRSVACMSKNINLLHTHTTQERHNLHIISNINSLYVSFWYSS